MVKKKHRKPSQKTVAQQSAFIDSAIKAIQRGQLSSTQKQLQRFLSEHPDSAEALHLLGLVYFQQEKHSLAIELFTQAVGINAKAPDYHINLALAYRDDRQFSAATQACLQAIKLEPDNKHHQLVLTSIYQRQGQYDKAIACCKHYIEAVPSDSYAYCLLGELYNSSGAIDAALSLYERWFLENDVEKHCLEQHNLATHPELPLLYLQLANCLLQLGHYQLATEHFQSALQLDDQLWQVCQGMGLLTIEIKQYALSVKWFQRGLSIAPEQADLLHGLGVALQHQGYYDEAIAAYQRAIRIDNQLQQSFYNMGNLLRVQGRYTLALQSFEQLRSINPAYPRLYSSLGHLFLDLGEMEKAKLAFQRGVEQGNDEFSVHMNNALLGRTSDKAPRGYVTELFDQYAGHFDEHIVGTLNYQGPKIIARMIDTLGLSANDTRESDEALDLGCGTGLIGEVLYNKGFRVMGVDVSIRMLDLAKGKQHYHALHHADIEEFLDGGKTRYKLIVAMDVCNYFGKLDTLLARVRDRLSSSGYMIFSTELLSEDNQGKSALTATGRYAHSIQYINELATAYRYNIVCEQRVILRQELGQSVNACVYALQLN